MLEHRLIVRELHIPGKCVLEQPGVKAPGTPKTTNLPLLVSSAKLTFLSGAPSKRSTEGTASPSLTGAMLLVWRSLLATGERVEIRLETRRGSDCIVLYGDGEVQCS